MRVKRYHMPAMNLVDMALGATSQPIHITAAHAHQKQWLMGRLQSASVTPAAMSQASVMPHSIGENLVWVEMVVGGGRKDCVPGDEAEGDGDQEVGKAWR